MKRILLIAGAIMAVLIIALFTVPFLISKDVYRAQIEKTATNALQRDVALTGTVDLSVFPRISVGIGGVTIANPEGFPDPHMVKAGELRGAVKWMPLLAGRVDIEEIAFVDAEVKLHKLANGRANWEFESGATSPAPEGSESSGASVDAGIGSARLENASLTYQDDTSGALYELKALNLEASMQAMDKPLKMVADGLIQGEAFDMSLLLDSPEAITNEEAAAVVFKLTTAFTELSYDGEVDLAGTGRLNGAIDISSQDLRKLLDVAEVEIAPGETLRTFSTKGQINGTFLTVAIEDLKLALDDITGSGRAGLDLSGARPKLTGDLAMSALDLTPFLGETEPAAASTTPATTGWSTEPLDLSSLKAVDADLALSTPSLTIGEITLTDAAMAATLANGRLSVDLDRFISFGGKWNGTMVVNARTATPSYTFNMTSQSINIVEILTTFTGFENLTGVGNFEISASSSGQSLDAIVNALDGQLTSDLADGALKGINIAELVRTTSSLQSALTSGNWSNLNLGAVMSDTAETDFSSFNTVLSIEDGVANVDLMKLVNPVLSMNGTGKIDLGGQTLDLKLATGIDQTAQGQESTLKVNGIPVPVKVSGPWTKLSISPDISGIRSALSAGVSNQLKDEITNRIGGNTGSLLGTVLNGKTDDEDKSDNTDKAVRDALGSLFGRDD